MVKLENPYILKNVMEFLYFGKLQKIHIYSAVGAVSRAVALQEQPSGPKKFSF